MKLKYKKGTAIPQLLYGSETYIREAKDISKYKGQKWFSWELQGVYWVNLKNLHVRWQISITESLNDVIF